MADQKNPRLFVSYAHTSPDHIEWVINLSKELAESGVDVILDKWELKEGQDKYAFMEKMVTDDSIKKVIMILDRVYMEKANKRKGGAGTETQIITPKIYKSVNQTKFVGIISERDENDDPYVPTFFESRIYIDLSSRELYEENFEQLVRWVYDKPLHKKPAPGKKPAFLNESEGISLNTTPIFFKCKNAIINNKPNYSGVLAEYLETFSTNLENFRLPLSNGRHDFDESILESIEKFTPYRNEITEIFSLISNRMNDINAVEKVHRFFESLIPFLFEPEGVNSYYEYDFDNYRFIVPELFLYCIANFIKSERFEYVSYLTQNKYYVKKLENHGYGPMHRFSQLNRSLLSLHNRNQRLSLGRASLKADILRERCEGTKLKFNDLMQADFLLFIADSVLSALDGGRQNWIPESNLYKSHGAYEIFARASSKIYFDRLKSSIAVKNKEDLDKIIEFFRENKLYTPNWPHKEMDILESMNYKDLCKYN